MHPGIYEAISALRPNIASESEGSVGCSSARVLLEVLLTRLATDEAQLAMLDAELDHLAQTWPEFATARARLDSLPGVGLLSAAIILGEIGWDMTRFGSDKQLASWTAVCPGNRVSAGKSKSGRTAKGNTHLRRILCECACGAIRTDKQQTPFGRKHHALAERMPKPKAILAVAHQLLRVMYAMLKHNRDYDPQFAEQQRQARRLSNVSHSSRATTDSEPR